MAAACVALLSMSVLADDEWAASTRAAVGNTGAGGLGTGLDEDGGAGGASGAAPSRGFFAFGRTIICVPGRLADREVVPALALASVLLCATSGGGAGWRGRLGVDTIVVSRIATARLHVANSLSVALSAATTRSHEKKASWWMGPRRAVAREARFAAPILASRGQ
jgi:hypothetical protein